MLVTHLLVGLLTTLVFVSFVLLAGVSVLAQEDGGTEMAGFFLLFGIAEIGQPRRY